MTTQTDTKTFESPANIEFRLATLTPGMAVNAIHDTTNGSTVVEVSDDPGYTLEQILGAIGPSLSRLTAMAAA